MKKVIFYNTDEEIIYENRYDLETEELYNYIQKRFNCNNNMPYKKLNNKLYGYIGEFNCYGRFCICDENVRKIIIKNMLEN